MSSSSPRRSRSGARRPVYYVLSTHWDREWLQTFQGFRHRLVQLMDRVLDDLAAGRLQGPFTTDGQAVIIEDYLEIRADRAEELRLRAREGALKIGPWYVLPDEWLVSGEAIVRNLQLGRAVARQHGGTPSSAGFVCDLFGHVSQLPQIFAGFGIRHVLLWRGLEPRAHAHFWWEGADGTRVLGYRFPRTGYCDYDYDVRRCHQPDQAFEPERAHRDLVAHLAKEAKRNQVDPILLFDGGDHLQYDADYYRALFGRPAGPAFPYAVRAATLDEYLEAVAAQSGRVRDVVRGELRETAVRPTVEDQQWLIPGVLSSRVWIKQANMRCQLLLCHWTEPLGAMASSLCGARYPADFLRVAWRWLLLNHPHDSMCGCSVDAVHRDMEYRFAQCEQIADLSAREALVKLAARAAGPVGPGERRVLVANPLPRPLDETVELTLHVPAEWGTFQEFFGFEAKPAFRLHGPDGAELPYQRLAQDPNRGQVRVYPAKFPQPFRTHDVTVAVRLRLPALGYAMLTLREGARAAADAIVAAVPLPTRYPATPGIATSGCTMDNGILAVRIGTNGTLDLTDRRTGETYRQLLTFEDIADIGDGWYHGQAVNDQAFVSTAAVADVALVHNGPELARFRIRTVLRLPPEFRFDRMVRAADLGELVIDSLVSLARGSDRLEVRTRVDNRIRDHRLRVLLPTGTRARTYLADSAFDVVERPVALPADNHLRRELAVETGPQQTWTAVTDRRRGLAVVAPGLMETAVRDDADRTLALTLFRATRRTIFTDGEPEGQLQRELSFHYWIVPVRGTVDRARLCDLGVQLGAGLRDVQLAAVDVATHAPGAPALPPVASFLAVTGGLVITSVREQGGGLEVRGFNPGDRTLIATFDFRGRPTAAPIPTAVQPVNLEGEATGRRTRVARGMHRQPVRPRQIVTLRFTC